MEGEFTVNNIKYKNIITYRGYTIMFERLCLQTSTPPFEYIGIGLGATPPDINDSSLEYEIGREKANYTHIPGSNSFALSATFGKKEISGLISEVGIFNKPHGGDMLSRAIIAPPKWKSIGQALPIVWKLAF
jgi:hypothetical protein